MPRQQNLNAVALETTYSSCLTNGLIHLRTKDRVAIRNPPSIRMLLRRELLLLLKFYSEDTVSRNVLILGIPSPVVIVIDDMVAVVGSWRVPAGTTSSN
ncbi:hypothetical protein Tco_0757530 [Tanacetum coccineum]